MCMSYSEVNSALVKCFDKPATPAIRFSLKRVRLNQGGYDATGTYWGIGQPLYYFEYAGDDKQYFDCYGHLRADSRGDAQFKVQRLYPTATFYR